MGLCDSKSALHLCDVYFNQTFILSQWIVEVTLLNDWKYSSFLALSPGPSMPAFNDIYSLLIFQNEIHVFKGWGLSEAKPISIYSPGSVTVKSSHKAVP